MVDQEIRVLGDENIIANPKNSQKQYPLTFKAASNVIVYGRKKEDLNFTVPIAEGTNFNFNLERTAIIFSDSFNLEEYSYIMVKNPFEEISDFFYVSSLEELDPTGKEFNEFNDEVVKWLRRLVNIISNRCMIFETTLFKDLNNFPNIKSGQTFLRTDDGWTGITIRDINSELDVIFNKYVEEINKKIKEHETKMNELLEQWKKDIQKYAENVKQYEIVRVVTQSGHGFVFEPVMYSISQRKFVKAVFPHGADGIAVRVDDNNFRLLWAGRVEIPSTAKDTQQRDFVLGEYYFLGEGSNGGIQREKPDTYYQHLFQVMYSDELQQNIADVLLSVPINQKGKRWDVGEAKTTVSDIEELKMSDFTVGKVVEVLGYYSAGDGATHKRVIADTDDGSGVQLRSGKWANAIKETISSPKQFGWTYEDSQANKDILTKYVKLGYANNTYSTICNLGTFLTEWISGNKFPIAFYGDSTTDGATTTGHLSNYSNGVDFTSNITIRESPNSYCNKTEEFIKLVIGSKKPVNIYNAGFDSMALSNDFGIDFFDRVFFGKSKGKNNIDYSDVKGIVLAWGTSDSINLDDTKVILESYPHKLEMLVINCFERGIQPFICHPVLNFQRKGTTEKGRDNDESISIIENINKKIAEKYNLELLSLREPLETYVEYAENQKGDFLEVLAPDGVHPNDKGHKMIASYMAMKLCNLIKKSENGYKFTAGNPYVITVPDKKGADIWKEVVTSLINTGTSFFYKFSNLSKKDFIYRIYVYCDKPIDLIYKGLSINKTVGTGLQAEMPLANIVNYVDSNSNKSITLYSDYEGAKAPLTSGGYFKITKLNVGLNVLELTAPMEKEGTFELNLGYLQMLHLNINKSYTDDTTKKNVYIYSANNIYELSGGILGKRWSESEFKQDGSNYYTSYDNTWKHITFKANTLNNRAVLFCANRNLEDFDTYNKLKFEGDKVYVYVVSNGVEDLIHTETLNINLNTLKNTVFQFQINRILGRSQQVYLSRLDENTGAVVHMCNFTLTDKMLLNGGFSFGIEKYSSSDGTSVSVTDIIIKYIL